MFVRWRQRRLRRVPDVTHHALLVRSVWHQGQTRQEVVCYLASIREHYRAAPAHRLAFWRWVTQRLATVPLDTATRQAVETQLARVVPPPTPDEVQAVHTQRAVLGQLAAKALRAGPGLHAESEPPAEPG